MKVTLKQLAVFEAVARLGSIKEAAKERSMSQSAATMSLQDLESNLRVQLFHRYKKRLTLNENGRRLQPEARSVLLQVDRIESVSRQENKLRGRLKVAATTTTEEYVLPAICRDFLAKHPDVKIRVKTNIVAESLNLVESMACDVALVEVPVQRPSLIANKLVSYPIAIFAAPEHPLASCDSVNLEVLRDQAWFVPSVDSFTRNTLTLALGDHFGSMNIRFESDSTKAIKDAVIGSSALGCLPLFAISEEIAEGTLVEIQVSDLHLSRSLHLIYRNDVYHGEVQQAFINQVMATLSPTHPGQGDRGYIIDRPLTKAGQKTETGKILLS